ncbi:MAG: tetratricopeptide repeat protein [Flavobacteriales bacterium]|nr:tetratricopeptide repeat protein [Flavobacteriales bacterium]
MRAIFPRRIVLFLLLRALLPAKASVVDSLRSALADASTDTAYAITAADLAQAFLAEGEVDSALRYAGLGITRLEVGRSVADDAARWLIRLHKLKGIGHGTASAYDSSLVEFQLMYRYAERLQRVDDMGASLTYQGYELREIGDVANCIEVTRRAIDVLASRPEGSGMANAYNGLGLAYAALMRTDSALHWLNRAALLYERLGDRTHLLNAYTNIAEVYNTAGQYERSDSIWERSSALVVASEDPVAYLHFAAGNARKLLREGRAEVALVVLDSAIGMAREMDHLVAVHHLAYLRAMARSVAGDWPGAYADMALSKDAQAEDLNNDKVRSVEALRQQHERERERIAAEAELRRHRTQKQAGIAIGALGLLLAMVAYRSYRIKSRTAETLRIKNEEIQRAQAQLVESEKKREAEEVRTRIARDIHDEIGATLTKIALLSGLATQKTRDPEELGRTFARIGEHTRLVSRALSDVVWAVDPQRDTHQGLLDHVRDLAQRLLGDNGIRFELDLRAVEPDAHVEPALKRDLHLVLNECFNNILKYAHARLVRVRLDLQGGTFDLRVDDDGVGFDPAQVPDRGNGLRNMPARMVQHGAALTVASAPGRGTVLHAHGPLR